MTRLRLNWVFQLCALVTAIACGSSKNDGGLGANVSVGGQYGSTVGGNAYSSGGNNSNGGVNGNAGNNATAGNGVGANTPGGNGSGTGSTGSTSDGGDGNGGAGNFGGDGTDATGGAQTVDVKVTGGTGNSTDVATGGSGSSVDVATGGAWTIDVATGGGNSIDTATGGGNSIDTATGGGGSIDTATGGGGSIDTATGGGSSVDTPKCLKTDLNNVNVYVIKDVTDSGGAADTEGNMYVGGSITTNHYSIGLQDATKDCSQYALVVGGNVTGVIVHNGSAIAGGTVTDSTDDDCGGVKRGKVPVDFPTLEAKVESLSIALETQLVANGTVTTNGSGLLLKGTDPVQNVFNISASQLGTVTIDVPTTSIVIVNVSGTNVTWPAGNVIVPGPQGGTHSGDYLFASNVIWNFYEAQTLKNTSAPIQGTILAPLATFTGGSGHVAGQVIVRAMTSLSVEYHPYYFSGCITWPKTT